MKLKNKIYYNNIMNVDDILKCLIAVVLGFIFAKYLKMEGFSPEVVANTALDDMNRRGCCISNTAGYSFNPDPVSEASPGFGTVSAFSNPCYPQQ